MLFYVHSNLPSSKPASHVIFCIYSYACYMVLQSISTIMLATITAVVFQITILMLHVIVAIMKQSKILYSRRARARAIH